MIDLKRENLARIVKIEEVMEHPNADRLDLVRIDEWQCVVQKGLYKVGDFVIYFEIDSILPEDVENKIFGPDSKVKLSKSRVKTIKLRKQISQGLVVPVELFFNYMPSHIDVTKDLGIGKYVPTPKKDSVLYVGTRKAGVGNENFKKMRKPTHSKNNGAFYGSQVMITEKIHGTSFVAGYVERESRTLFQKIRNKFFGKYQFCYRSMNNQLQPNDSLWANIKRKFGNTDDAAHMEATLYGRIARNYDLKHVLCGGEVICGEIYGSGVQAGYSYGCQNGIQKLAVFGFRFNGKELPPVSARIRTETLRLPFVPVLYVGESSQEIVEECSVGKSVLDPKTPVREGCVTASLDGRAKLGEGVPLTKTINPKYLLKDQTEFN